ncbi:MAG: right-handed parallel beta-helix repeat-containing protein [Thermogutta sp.]
MRSPLPDFTRRPSRTAGFGVLLIGVPCVLAFLGLWMSDSISGPDSASAAAVQTPTPAAATEQPVRHPVSINAKDYPNLQAALDVVSQNGGLLTIPPGDYLIEEPLLVSGSEVRIVGSGPATRIINQNKEGKPALVIRPGGRETDRRARLWRVELAHLRIQGDPAAIDAKTTAPASGPGVVAEGVNEFFLHGVGIDHNGGHGLLMVDCYEDPRICDCIITYNKGAGIYLQACHDIVVNANQLEENQQAVVCVDSFNLCMNGNNLDDHLGEGVVIENTYGSVLSGNMIEECQGPAIVLDRDCYGITISANVLADNFGGAIELRDAWGCTVSANTFTINPIFGIKVGPASGRITITGNNFSDSYIGGQTRRTDKANLATGIVLDGTTDIVISGNQFSGLSEAAVTARGGCQRLVITGNIVRDVAQSRPEDRKAFDLGNATNVVLTNNILPEEP